jgi:hypothetical protein
MSEPLRMLAEDADDLQVISAALQDAVTRIGDIQFSRRERAVTIAFNRFRWETDGRRGERVRAGLQVGSVLDVKARKLRRDAKDAVLELLTLVFEPGEAPGGVITFTFAGGGDLAVSVECVDAALADLGQPWPTRRKPAHEA